MCIVFYLSRTRGRRNIPGRQYLYVPSKVSVSTSVGAAGAAGVAVVAAAAGLVVAASLIFSVT